MKNDKKDLIEQLVLRLRAYILSSPGLSFGPMSKLFDDGFTSDSWLTQLLSIALKKDDKEAAAILEKMLLLNEAQRKIVLERYTEYAFG